MDSVRKLMDTPS